MLAAKHIFVKEAAVTAPRFPKRQNGIIRTGGNIFMFGGVSNPGHRARLSSSLFSTTTLLKEGSCITNTNSTAITKNALDIADTSSTYVPSTELEGAAWNYLECSFARKETARLAKYQANIEYDNASTTLEHTIEEYNDARKQVDNAKYLLLQSIRVSLSSSSSSSSSSCSQLLSEARNEDAEESRKDDEEETTKDVIGTAGILQDTSTSNTEESNYISNEEKDIEEHLSVVKKYKNPAKYDDSFVVVNESKFLSSGGCNNQIRLWDVNTGTVVSTIAAENFFNCFTIIDDDRFLSSADTSGNIKLWNLSTGECIRTFIGHTHAIHSIAKVSDDVFVSSSNYDKTIRLWQISTGICIDNVQENINIVFLAAIDDNKIIYAENENDAGEGTIKLWDLSERKSSVNPKALAECEPVWSLFVCEDKKFFITEHWDGNIKRWDVETGRCVQSLDPYDEFSHQTEMTMISNNKLFFSCYDDQIRILDATTGKHKQNIDCSWINDMKDLGNGKIVVVDKDHFQVLEWKAKETKV